MKIFSNKLNRRVGRPPGDTTYTDDDISKVTEIKLLQYNNDEYKEYEIHSAEDLNVTCSDDVITWVQIEGVSDAALINKIAEYFAIDDMVIEDVLNSEHIPKYEEGDDYITFILKSFNDENLQVEPTHVTLYYKKNLVISFEENPNKLLDTKMERIKTSKGRARSKKGDYLFFVLMDTFIDSYYSYFESLREITDELDNKLLLKKNENHINDIYKLKNKLTSIRKNLFPLKSAINELLSDRSKLLAEKNIKYFNDCKDNVNELIEYYHSFENYINNLVALNENNLSDNTNRVMKVLTIIATIFIPLTFIAGIYGMNFKHMPELEWEHGYHFALTLMLVIGLAIVGFMKYKKWF